MYPAPITAALSVLVLNDIKFFKNFLKDISLEYTLYRFYFKDWREKIGIYFSLILLNSYFAKLFTKIEL
jgi:hypothetical protein